MSESKINIRKLSDKELFGVLNFGSNAKQSPEILNAEEERIRRRDEKKRKHDEVIDKICKPLRNRPAYEALRFLDEVKRKIELESMFLNSGEKQDV